MPRDLKSHPENGIKFIEKVKHYHLHTVLILTETEEYEKYAGEDLESFYKSIPIEIIHRPVADFTVPNQVDMINNINDLTERLADGKNCLVHCAGGKGRTGTIIAGVMKNIGVSNPVAYIRQVNPKYVETKAQETFVESMPPVLDDKIAKKHPFLAKAIAAQQLLDFLLRTNKVPWTCVSEEHAANIQSASSITAHWKDLNYTFSLIDTDHSGFITVNELQNLFENVGANITVEQINSFMSSDDDRKISRSEFEQLMSQSSVHTATSI